MTILGDESASGSVLDRLRADGFVVQLVRDISPGVPDTVVLTQSVQSGAIVVTEDKDFGELVFRQGLSHVGVVLLRLEGVSRPRKADLASQAFRDHGHEFVGAFTVISPGGIRIRRPTPPPPTP
jgi:predicted nuclease of predicted toxin-antitoxin system